MTRETWHIVPRNSVANRKALPSFKFNSKPDRNIIKIKACYCMRGDVQKLLSPERLDLYYPVVQWSTVRWMLILNCIIGLQSQIIYFTNDFYLADIPSGDLVLIEIPRYFKIDGDKCDVVIRLKKILYR